MQSSIMNNVAKGCDILEIGSYILEKGVYFPEKGVYFLEIPIVEICGLDNANSANKVC